MSTVRVYQHQAKPYQKVDNTKVTTRFLEKQISFQKQEKLKTILVNGSLLCLALFLTIQFVRGTVINFDRYVTLNTKMAGMQALNLEATHQNEVLQKKYKSYNSPEGLEGLARDYLNLVGENEISVILKKS